MPFKNRAQQKACYAKHDPKWNCHEFAGHAKERGSRSHRVQVMTPMNRARQKRHWMT